MGLDPEHGSKVTAEASVVLRDADYDGMEGVVETDHDGECKTYQVFQSREGRRPEDSRKLDGSGCMVIRRRSLRSGEGSENEVLGVADWGSCVSTHGFL